jgi:hypothetical protein
MNRPSGAYVAAASARPPAMQEIAVGSGPGDSNRDLTTALAKSLIGIKYPPLEQNPSLRFYCIPSCGGKIGEARQ